MVTTKLPASGLLTALAPMRETIHLHTRAEPATGKKSPGTSGLLAHLTDHHPAEYKLEEKYRPVVDFFMYRLVPSSDKNIPFRPVVIILIYRPVPS